MNILAWIAALLSVIIASTLIRKSVALFKEGDKRNFIFPFLYSLVPIYVSLIMLEVASGKKINVELFSSSYIWAFIICIFTFFQVLILQRSEDEDE
jgi:hypothetical protein